MHTELSDEEMLRYNRQIVLRGFALISRTVASLRPLAKNAPSPAGP